MEQEEAGKRKVKQSHGRNRPTIKSVDDLNDEDYAFIKEYVLTGERGGSYKRAYSGNDHLTWEQAKSAARGLMENRIIIEQINLFRKMHNIQMFDSISTIKKKDKVERDDILVELIAMKDLCLKDGNHKDALRYYDMICKISSFYAPKKVEVEQKKISLSFGGWNPNTPPELPAAQPTNYINITPAQIPKQTDVEPDLSNEQ